jgi:hypothetical protein
MTTTRFPARARVWRKWEIMNKAVQYVVDLFMLPSRARRIEIMGEQTNAALAELASAVDEVAGELDTIADNADGQTADAIRGQASRLRNLRPDTPPVEDPEPQPEV